jgi:integrase
VATLVPVELTKHRDAIKLVRLMYGEVPAMAFDAVAYAAVRSRMVESGLCISTIRARLGVIKRMISWGVVRGMIPDHVPRRIEALEKSEPLRVGQPGVRAPREVKPVPAEDVEKIYPHVTPVIRAMLELQLNSGLRPGEVAKMTAGQLDRSGDQWIYRPLQHKTKHLGKTRVVPLGPRAMAVLLPWIKDDPDAPLFSPRESYLHGHKLTGKKPRRFRPTYNKASYANAVARGCERAGIPAFRPNRIRHTYATRVREALGIEAAQVMLGHSRADVTQIYAEKNLNLAKDVAKAIG